jgi:carboxypeptidase family protein/TonB-dependent receptor-like protein
MQRLFVRSIALLAVMVLLFPGALLAQTSRTTGALQGTVTDTKGSPLPGVTVTVTSPQLQGSRTEVTDTDGKYAIPALPPGTYRAEYTLSGVKNQVREGIEVHAQQAPAINVSMEIGVSETVTVTASQVVVDPTQTQTQHVMDQDHLKYTAVGSANRSYQNVLTQAPGVNTAGGNPQVSGANNAQNDWYVDGVNSTDPVTHTFGGNMAFDAIQEISIVTLGKDAEYKSSGGTVNVITKSGGNQFSGSFDYRYNDPDYLVQGSEKKFVAPAYFGGPLGAESLRFDKKLQTDKSEQPQATLGGPIMRDKLWFFVATHKPETNRVAPNLFGFQPADRTFTGWNTHGKLTFTPLTNQTFTGKFTDSHALITSTASNGTSSFFRPEAETSQTQHSWIYAGAYDAVLSPKWLANLQFSHRPSSLASFPQSGDLKTVGITDSPTSIRSANATNNQGRTAERNELIGSTTYYLEKMGTHAFKFGVNAEHTEFTSYNNATGDPSTISGFDAATFCNPAFTYTIGGVANHLPAGAQCTAIMTTNVNTTTAVRRIAMGIILPESTVEGDSRSFYIQDEWRPIPRLTARLGVRYDTTDWDNHGGAPPPSFELWQPRVGVAYDIFDNASTVVHAYGGKIGDENQLTYPSFGVAQPLISLRFNQNASGVWSFSPTGSLFSASGGLYDDKVDPSYSNQFSAGVTQRLFRNTSVDLTLEKRTQHNLFEDYCGSLNDPLDCYITNQPGPAGSPQALRADWRGAILKIDSRPVNWIDLSFSWTHSKSRGSTESTQNQNTSFDTWPNNFINTYGYLSDDARERLKLNGYARLPWNFIFGVSHFWDSGQTYSISRTDAVSGGTEFLEPRGSRRLPHLSQTDIQLQKDFDIGRFKIGLIGSVQNLFNTETVTGVNGNPGTLATYNGCATKTATDPVTFSPCSAADRLTGLYTDPNQQTGPKRFAANFLQPTAFQRPRRFEVGVRFEF